MKCKLCELGVTVAAPFISAAAGYIVWRVILKPARELRKGLEVICRGNLDYKVGTVSRNDIGQISRAVDKIVCNLKKAAVYGRAADRDEAEHGKTIEKLREREEYFRRLFEQSNDAVFLYNFEGRIQDVNRKACDMLLCSKDSLIGMSFLNLHTEEELIKSKEAFKADKEVWSVRFESRFKRFDGGIIDVEISSGIVDLKKEIMQGIVRDITSRKQLERALKESEERFRTFMESASDLMQIMDADNRFLYVNSAMLKTMGYSKEEMLNMRLNDILNKKTLEGTDAKARELITEGEISYEPVWVAKDAREIHGEMKLSAIYNDEGRFIGSRGIFRDITERKKVEESQRLAQLGRLVADMTHEIKNPITIISARAQLSLMQGVKEEERIQNIKTILAQCEQAQDIIQRLLKFSKPSKGIVSELNINEEIETVIGLVEHVFLLSKIKIEKNLDISLPLIKADGKQLQEVFMNLLRNAFEAMPQGGTITLVTKDDQGRIKIDVRDQGSGIKEEDMKKIFDPFFTTKENGTGLGLSVCYGIIKSHGGDLKYTSVPGEGTTATILIPI